MSTGNTENYNMSNTCKRFMPHILVVLMQIGYTVLYFVAEACFNHGMSPHVFVTYRHTVGCLAMFPFAFCLERKVRPKLTLALLAEIFVLSLFGAALNLNMYFASFHYVTPTFIASMINTISSMIFVIAVLLRLEVVDIWNLRGLAKVTGTLVSLAGITIMTLYKGLIIPNIWHPLLPFQSRGTKHENWVKGSVLTIGSCISWSVWYIMQAYTIKRYPAPLSLTTWMSGIGAVQSAIYTLCVQRKPTAWKVGFNIDLWSIIYAGVVCSGLMYFAQFWCINAKGPVFVTMFSPLATILVAIVAYFVFQEKLYLGSVIGAIIVIVGLYLLLWGKEVDHAQENRSKFNVNCKETWNRQRITVSESKGNNMMKETNTRDEQDAGIV